MNVAPIGRAGLIGRFLSAGLFLALFMWAAYQLRLIVKSVKFGAPFDPENPKRIRWIGLVTLILGPF